MKNFILLFTVIILFFGSIFIVINRSKENDNLLNQTIEANKESKEGLGSGSNQNQLAQSASEKDLNMNAVTLNNAATNTKNIDKQNTKTMQENKNTYTVEMKTNKGNMVLELDRSIAPNTVDNFVKLANSKFYDGIKFHRVIKDFMIQAGDPQSKDDTKKDIWGTGGPGYKFADEVQENGKIKAVYNNGYKRGVIAMANSGPNTNGSQFFIMHADVALPPAYTIFGKVVSGLDAVDAIARVDKDRSDKPLENVIINSIIVK